MEIYAVGHGTQIQEIAGQRGDKEIQQEKQHAAADGKGKAEKILPVGGIQSADGRVVAQQCVHGYAQCPGQGGQQSHVRISASAFPAGNGFVGYAKLVGQLLLGQVFGFAETLEPFGKFHLGHKGVLLFEGK